MKTYEGFYLADTESTALGTVSEAEEASVTPQKALKLICRAISQLEKAHARSVKGIAKEKEGNKRV